MSDRCPNCDRAECDVGAALADWTASDEEKSALIFVAVDTYRDNRPERESLTARRRAISERMTVAKAACVASTVDWRARALDAEERLASLEQATLCFLRGGEVGP